MQTTTTSRTYAIDPAHSEVGFVVRHLMISKVHGHFTGFSGKITVTGEGLVPSKIEGSIDTTSVATRQEQRDAHLRSAEFFDVEKFPAMTFASTSISGDEKGFSVTGDLTLRGVTKSITLEGEAGGAATDARGNERVGYSFSGRLNRGDFGITFGTAMVGDEVGLTLEVSAILQK